MQISIFFVLDLIDVKLYFFSVSSTNLFSFWLTIFQSCVAFPVLEVNFAKAPNNQLQLSLVKALEQLLWDELVEALLQGQKLGLDPVHKSEIKPWVHAFSFHVEFILIKSTKSVDFAATLKAISH